ncbi:MAG: hypothetical protein DME19_02220, partial [Verrucomicrobia bacterium]
AAFALRGLTSGALLGGLLLAVFWKKGRGVPVIVGMTASLAVMILLNTNTLLKEKIFWPWFTLIGTLVTITVALFLAPLFPSSTEMDRSSGKREAPAAPASVP